MAGLDYFTFVADTNAAQNFTASPVELTNPFTRTVASGSDWEVDDIVPYRLKYIGSRLKIFRISGVLQQSSSSVDIRPEVGIFDTFPIVDGNGGPLLVNGNGAVSTGILAAYPNGYFIVAIPNTVYGFSLRARNNLSGTSFDWTLTLFINILR